MRMATAIALTVLTIPQTATADCGDIRPTAGAGDGDARRSFADNRSQLSLRMAF